MTPPLKLCACIFCICILKITTHCVLASKVSKYSAEQVCAKYGGLLSYQFLLDKSCRKYRSDDQKITDGESAWVSEFANYSNLVSWQGCYSEVDGSREPTNDSTGLNIFVCLTKCKDKPNTNFIGLQANVCRCMSNANLGDSPKASESACGDWDNYTVMPDLANGTKHNFNPYDKNIPVYKIHEHAGIAWDLPFDQSFGQCVYMEKFRNGSEHFTIKYNTKSCYSKEEIKKNGLVCVSKQPFPNDTCTTFQVESKYYCVKSSTSNWLEANQECRSLNGNLINIVTDITEEMENNTQINIKYWTGLFRDFIIVSGMSTTSDDQVCLSVRNISNRLVLEPGDCSEQKQVLCNKPFGNDDNTNDSESTTDFQKSSYLGPVVIISLTFNGVLLSITATGAVIIYRKTRRTRHRKKIEKRKAEEERAKTTYDHIDLKTNTLPKDGTNARMDFKT